jgi:hypothetical protein
MTGWLATKFAQRHPNAIAWLPGVGIILAVPFYLLAYSATNIWVCLAFLMCGALVKYGYIGAQYTIGQGVVGARTRATAIAILLFVVNLIGLGLGPLFIGVLSEFLFAPKIAAAGFPELTQAACRAGAASLDEAQRMACRTASAASLRDSLRVVALMHVIPGVFFFLCARVLQKDMIAK